PRGGRPHEPRDRRSAVHQPEHGRVPPPQSVPQARRQVANAAGAPHVVVGPLTTAEPASSCGLAPPRAESPRSGDDASPALWRRSGCELVDPRRTRYLMTSQGVRDPLADHLITPQNAALVL